MFTTITITLSCNDIAKFIMGDCEHNGYFLFLTLSVFFYFIFVKGACPTLEGGASTKVGETS